LGGRSAEIVVIGEASSGAANDLAGATQMASRMVTEFGLSPALGPVGYSSGNPEYLGAGLPDQHPYSDETQRLVDGEVARLIREAEQRATELLGTHRDKLDRLAALLREKETIDGAAVYALVGRTPPQPPLLP
jgi:cell division protease FtsH